MPPTNKVVIGTRGSLLALAQTRLVADRLHEVLPDLELTIETIVTSGDRAPQVPLPQLGQKGVFTAELEQALIDGRIDIAVHSAKDLPARLADGLAILCTPQREDPRDVLVSRNHDRLVDLPQGALIGTGSLRRSAQLRLIRPDLQFIPLRGNIDTRIHKTHSRQCDAAILALAGLKRAGLTEHVTDIFELDQMLPAPNQGILAIEGRADDTRLSNLLAPINHAETAEAFHLQSRIVDLLAAGCTTPLGALVTVSHHQIEAACIVLDPQGTHAVRTRQSGPRARATQVIEQAVLDLRRQGAAVIIQSCRND